MDRRAVVVTGAGRGIGAAICRKMAPKADLVVLLDVDRAPAEEIANEIEQLGTETRIGVVDVGVSRNMDDVLRPLIADLGAIDSVIGAAGCMAGSPVEIMTDDVWEKVVDVNLKGAFALVRSTIPLLRNSVAPRVVLLSSVASRGLLNNVNYSAAKAGIGGLTRSLAWELGPQGILVNAVAPGFIDTRMTRAGAERRGVSWEEFVEDAVTQTAIGRIGEAEEIAHVVDFLASPGLTYLTGQVLTVSGAP